MAAGENVFVMRERVERLERMFEQIIEIDGLKDLARDATEKFIKEAVEAGKLEVKESASSHLRESKEFTIERIVDAKEDLQEGIENLRKENVHAAQLKLVQDQQKFEAMEKLICARDEYLKEAEKETEARLAKLTRSLNIATVGLLVLAVVLIGSIL
jgi:hypothetical protein